MYQHLLVPIDASALADELMKEALDYAKSVKARITFFHALPDEDGDITGEATLLQSIAPEALRHRRDENTHHVLDKAVALAAEAGVPCRSLALPSRSPSQGIVDAAASSGCDLIFMASHGRRTSLGMMLGSVTLKTLTHAQVPVLVSSIGKAASSARS